MEEIHAYQLRIGKPVSSTLGSNYTLFAAANRYNQFNDLATQSGRSLPTFLKTALEMFPSGSRHSPIERNDAHFVDWCTFLWAASPASYQRCIDPQDNGARKAVWQGGNPFLASVLAIDLFVRGYGLDTVPLFNRRLVDVCPWFTAEDRQAAIVAVTVAYLQSDRDQRKGEEKTRTEGVQNRLAPKKKRGRPRVAEKDPKRVEVDLKLYRDWQVSGLTQKEFLRERNIPENDGLDQLGRGKHYAKKSGNNSDS